MASRSVWNYGMSISPFQDSGISTACFVFLAAMSTLSLSDSNIKLHNREVLSKTDVKVCQNVCFIMFYHVLSCFIPEFWAQELHILCPFPQPFLWNLCLSPHWWRKVVLCTIAPRLCHIEMQCLQCACLQECQVCGTFAVTQLPCPFVGVSLSTNFAPCTTLLKSHL